MVPPEAPLVSLRHPSSPSAAGNGHASPAHGTDARPPHPIARPAPIVRRWFLVRGLVQGVGFRPTVYRLARALNLSGWVRNERGAVRIEVEGTPEELRSFLDRLPSSLSPPAKIDSLQDGELAPVGELGFQIAPSAESQGGNEPGTPADLAACDACLEELHDPSSRRYRYPFTNCASCGPRFTIIQAPPYGRERTTMAPFALCAACTEEYSSPEDRRFHAEATSCPACGPRLSFLRFPAGPGQRHIDPLFEATSALHLGAIVAVKGAGGFLLACDATNPSAVDLLRRRKRRPDKPLAVMGRSLAHLESIAALDEEARTLLRDPSRPIVIAPLLERGPLAPGIAPALREVGVFLPPTPLQQLLLEEGPPLQVMTSGNASGAPIARTNGEALEELAPLADAILFHDREIHSRADDSVIRLASSGAFLIRRGRGFTPQVVDLPVSGPPLLAVGAGERNTVCLAAEGSAILSPHLGSLEDPRALQGFEHAIEHLVGLRGVKPSAIAHDLHPDLPSTRWALRSGLPLVPVQHHHAHIATCLVEHGRTGPVLGVAFDGMGLGTDRTLWGGEILHADLHSFVRLAHLRPLFLAGGEAAIRAPWRVAAAALHDAGLPLDRAVGVDRHQVRLLEQLLERRISGVLSSGAGRYFDAVAALCGLRLVSSYDGQAPAELEAAASPLPPCEPFPFALIESPNRPLAIDLRSTIRALVRSLDEGASVPSVSARFHSTLAAAIARCCEELRSRGAPKIVALVGGCFQNLRLREETQALLESSGFEVLTNRRIPTNDGGISLGQAAIASSRLAAQSRGGGKQCVSQFQGR